MTPPKTLILLLLALLLFVGMRAADHARAAHAGTHATRAELRAALEQLLDTLDAMDDADDNLPEMHDA